MITKSTYDTKTQLSALLDKVVNEHEEIIITRHGKPIAKIVEIQEEPWRLAWGPFLDHIKTNCPPGEDIAPVFPDGIPWSDTDPV